MIITKTFGQNLLRVKQYGLWRQSLITISPLPTIIGQSRPSSFMIKCVPAVTITSIYSDTVSLINWLPPTPKFQALCLKQNRLQPFTSHLNLVSSSLNAINPKIIILNPITHNQTKEETLQIGNYGCTNRASTQSFNLLDIALNHVNVIVLLV